MRVYTGLDVWSDFGGRFPWKSGLIEVDPGIRMAVGDEASGADRRSRRAEHLGVRATTSPEAALAVQVPGPRPRRLETQHAVERLRRASAGEGRSPPPDAGRARPLSRALPDP